jgi:hypothetical protein
MKKDDKQDEENKSLDQVRLTEDFLQKLKITTNIPLRHMTLNDHESCAVRFISGMLQAKRDYQLSNDAFEEAISHFPQYFRSKH